MVGKKRALISVLLLAIPVLIYQLFFISRDRKRYVMQNIEIEIRTKHCIAYWQDVTFDKKVTMRNRLTGKVVSLHYQSIEPDIYFYFPENMEHKPIVILDKYSGKNEYDLMDLRLIGKSDCLNDEGCNGFNEYAFSEMGIPTITYSPFLLQRALRERMK